MKFKGRKIKIDNREARFDDPIDANEIRKDLDALRERRQALRAKMDRFEDAMRKLALEEIELNELLAEID